MDGRKRIVEMELERILGDAESGHESWTYQLSSVTNEVFKVLILKFIISQ